MAFTHSATIDDSASRTILAEDGATVHWKGDEQIGVFYTTTPTGGSNTTQNRNACYTLSSFDEATATLTGDIEWVEIGEGVHKFQMYYPYNETVKSSSAAFGTLPAEQVYDPAGWDISKYALAGVKAVGPILQGLNQPVNDLSRGTTADEIVLCMAVTILQSV